jgi:hypothetical protein
VPTPGIVLALTGARVTEAELPIAGYDHRTSEDITARLPGCSRLEQRLIGAYEARHRNREAITDRAAQLTGDDWWSAYDRAFSRCALDRPHCGLAG